MAARDTDLYQILEYRRAKEMVRQLPTGLLLIFLGLFLYASLDLSRRSGWHYVGIVLCFLFGIGLTAVALWTLFVSPGKPLFVLTPAGIHTRIPWVKEFLVPWHQIRGVETTDIHINRGWIMWLLTSPTSRYNTAYFPKVTVVLVSKAFYDAHIHINSSFLRGPGWTSHFIENGALVQMAIYHAALAVEPKALRAAIEARWHAFRDQTPAVADATAARALKVSLERSTPVIETTVVAMGTRLGKITIWEAIKIAVPLIGIAVVSTNLAGIWQLPGQSTIRESQAKAREERRYWQDAAKRRQEEAKEREREEKERRQSNEELLRRAFGR